MSAYLDREAGRIAALKGEARKATEVNAWLDGYDSVTPTPTEGKVKTYQSLVWGCPSVME